MISAFDVMLSSFPAGLDVPAELVTFFKWLEDKGLYRNFEGDGYRYALIDPAHERSCIAIIPPNPEDSKNWTDSDDPAIYGRLAIFCITGGDGSRAALWRDDNGQTQIVHLGSGSGSTMFGIFTANALDFLRLLAIGYDELCWPQMHNKTALEMFQERADENEEDLEDIALPSPVALRQLLISSFGTTIPDRATDIIGEVADMDDDHSDDSFWQWDHSLPKWQA